MVCESPNSPNNAIGGVATDAGNVIAFNGASGVLIYGASAIGNAIRSNSIFSNADLGIDLEADGVTPNDDESVNAAWVRFAYHLQFERGVM